MSLIFLVILVATGIAVIVLAVHLTGGSAGAVLADAAQARARFAQDHADATVNRLHLCTDGRAAFLELEDGRTGIVQALGGRFLTRIVTARDVADIVCEGDATISVRFRDFTWRGGAFAFGDPAAAKRIADRLGPVRCDKAEEM